MITYEVSQRCELGIVAKEISLGLRKLRQQEGKGQTATKQGTESTCQACLEIFVKKYTLV